MARDSLFLLVVMLLLAFTTASDENVIQMLKNRSATYYCGTNLSDVLSLVCRGKYNTPTKVHDHQKREEDETELEAMDLEDNRFNFPFISKLGTRAFLAKFRRRRHPRGVYNECCQKPCTFEVLKSYCGD